jgi:hypothetical protein
MSLVDNQGLHSRKRTLLNYTYKLQIQNITKVVVKLSYKIKNKPYILNLLSLLTFPLLRLVMSTWFALITAFTG